MIFTFIILFYYIFMCLIILLSIALFTLLEQKVLRITRIRLGPHIRGYLGLLQPIADAIKLLTKESFSFSFFSFFYIFPFITLILSLLLWLCIPNIFGGLNFEFRLLFFLVIRGLIVYPVFYIGWGSNSKYSLLGSLRGVSQIISYEISLIIILLRIIWLRIRFNFVDLWFNIIFNNFILFIPVCILWLVSILAETNRTPYDFSEGESELVSGFNTEYGSRGFTIIFMAEYTSILLISIIFIILFFSNINTVWLIIILKGYLIGFWFIWVRSSLPRYRYDKLIRLAWKSLLPIGLYIVCFYLFLGI